jgi:hypothetical protein
LFDGRIGKDTTAGATIDAALVTGLWRPCGLALTGSGHLLVANAGNDSIGKYLPSGVPVNPALIRGVHALDVLWVPEPSSAALFLAGAWILLRRKHSGPAKI